MSVLCQKTQSFLRSLENWSPKFHFRLKDLPWRREKKCSSAIQPILWDSELFQRSAPEHFFWLFLTLWNVGNSILCPKLYIRPLSQPNYLRYLESHLVRNVEITPKPVWALYWVTAPCFIEKTLILAVLLFCRHNENHFIHSLSFITFSLKYLYLYR